MMNSTHLHRLSTHSTRALSVLLITAFALACSSGKEEASAPSETPPTETSVEAPATLPAPGEAHVEISELGVTVIANDAPRIEILQKLASAAGFKLVLGTLSQEEPDVISVYAMEVSLTDALLQTLAGLPFKLIFGIDPEEGNSVLQIVSLDESRAKDTIQARSKQGKERGKNREGRRLERKERLSQRLASPEFAQEMAEKRLQQKERAAWASTQLDNADPQVRAEAASNIDANDDDEFARLADLLENDPDPAVRAAAADNLGDSDNPAALEYLKQALQDPSSEVKINAIDDLVFESGDVSLIPYFQPLLQDPDPEVREAAQDAIDFIE